MPIVGYRDFNANSAWLHFAICVMWHVLGVLVINVHYILNYEKVSVSVLQKNYSNIPKEFPLNLISDRKICSSIGQNSFIHTN